VVGVCTVFGATSASCSIELNLHDFGINFKFHVAQKYTLHLASFGCRFCGATKQGYRVKILPTSSTIIWSREIKVFVFVIIVLGLLFCASFC
jgi:hypothetical protein